MSFVINVSTAIRDLLNGINNTIWGVILLYVAVFMKMRHVDDAAVYYFAGIGSTLLGIQHGSKNSTENK